MILSDVLLGCAVYSALCVVMTAVNFGLLPHLSGDRPVSEEDASLVSIVVPARDEERSIEVGLRSLLAQRYPRFEVIVVDDRSTDATPAILSRLSSDARLRVVPGVEPPPGWLGKPHALAQGARAASGEILLFVDADVLYEPETLARAMGRLQRRRLEFLALLPRMVSGTFWEHVLMPNLLCAVFFGPAFLANSRWPRRLAAGGGAGNLVRRSAYDAVGGHEALRSSVIDDVRLAILVKSSGRPVGVVLASDLVAVRMYFGFREVWNGFTKNVAYAFGGLSGAAFLLIALWWTVAGILPAAVLIAALAGAPVPPASALYAAVSVGLLLLARVILAVGLSERLWPALFHPVMTAVWAALLFRSLYQRIVRRSVSWRGREFDARKAGF